MKRTIALAVLIAALAVLVKLALKPFPSSLDRGQAKEAATVAVSPFGEHSAATAWSSSLAAKYASEPLQVRELVARVVERFGRNAVSIERTEGLRGIQLLDRLDLEAIFLYEKHPAEFRRLRDSLGSDAAADLLLHWREYFGLKHADDTDRGILISEIAALTPAQQRAAARYPNALPLILADPAAVTAFIEGWASDEKSLADALVLLCFVSLEHGSSDLRSALRTFDHHGPLALEAFRRQGLDGFAIVSLFGPVLEVSGNSLPLNDGLILLHVNAEYVEELLRSHRPETVAGHLRHVAAAGLIEQVGGSPDAFRLVVEFGATGEQAIRKAGPDAADVVFRDFRDAIMRRQAVAALATHGTMALFVLDKYAADPEFREILRAQGAAVIPPIAQADAGPETLAYLGAKDRRSFKESLALAALFVAGDNGQAIIRSIRNDGLDRVNQLNSREIRYYQFLPLYDVIHLGNVVCRGYSPTSSELTWALVDGSFVVADVLSLAAVQPEGALGAEALHTELKAAAREGTRSAGRELVTSTAKAASRHSIGNGVTHAGVAGATNLSERLARWWTVRSAGGLYNVMRQLPEALPRLSVTQLSEMAGPLVAKAGIRVNAWKPIRLLKDGTEVVLRIPPQRGLKYLSAQAVQAGVGVVGFQKMEEHLASRRPKRP